MCSHIPRQKPLPNHSHVHRGPCLSFIFVPRQQSSRQLLNGSPPRTSQNGTGMIARLSLVEFRSPLTPGQTPPYCADWLLHRHHNQSTSRGNMGQLSGTVTASGHHPSSIHHPSTRYSSRCGQMLGRNLGVISLGAWWRAAAVTVVAVLLGRAQVVAIGSSPVVVL